MGNGENRGDSFPMDLAEPHSGVGSVFEDAWQRLAIGAGLAALVLGAWGLIKRYPGPSALYAAAIVAVIAFKM